MARTVNIKPVNEREKQIVRSLGNDNWEIVCKRDRVICLHDNPGFLIRKSGHTRWIKSAQVEEI